MQQQAAKALGLQQEGPDHVQGPAAQQGQQGQHKPLGPIFPKHIRFGEGEGEEQEEQQQGGQEEELGDSSSGGGSGDDGDGNDGGWQQEGPGAAAGGQQPRGDPQEGQQQQQAQAQRQAVYIMTGDMNSAPGSGIYRFLSQGQLDCCQEERRGLSGGRPGGLKAVVGRPATG